MINSVSLLRIFCCLQVFFLHYFARIHLREYMWIFFGAVPCFLLISAYLCGLKYGSGGMDKSFLIKRYKSLSSYYYPFVLGAFVFFSILNPDQILHYLPSAVLNLCYITTLTDPLPQCGHLWFMQTLAICYLGIYFLNNNFFRKLFTKGAYIAILFFICCCVGFIYRGPIIWYLFFYLLLFFNAKRIQTFIFTPPHFSKNYIFLIGSIALCYSLLSIDYARLFHLGIYFRYVHTCILAILTIILFLRLFKDIKSTPFITYSASITMEIYLVHHLFVFDKPLYISLPVTIILSIILHTIGSLIYNKIQIIK